MALPKYPHEDTFFYTQTLTLNFSALVAILQSTMLKGQSQEQSEVTDVQEPLLSEKRSYMKGGCFSSCGCLVIVVVLLLLILRITWGPATTTRSELPDNFPLIIPLYRSAEIQKIKVHTAVDVNRTYATFSAIPRLLINPLRAIRINSQSTTSSTHDMWKSVYNEVAKVFRSPATDETRDEYTILWGSIPDDIKKIQQFYVTELKKESFEIIERYNNTNNFEAGFSGNGITGNIRIENYDLRQPGVEAIKLVVSLPHIP